MIFLFFTRQSGSGKSSFISSVIQQLSSIVSPPPSKIIWIYNKYYKEYHEVLNQLVSNIEFYPDFDYDAIMSKIESEQDERYLLILDDILQFKDSLDLIFTRDANNLKFSGNFNQIEK